MLHSAEMHLLLHLVDKSAVVEEFHHGMILKAATAQWCNKQPLMEGRVFTPSTMLLPE